MLARIPAGLTVSIERETFPKMLDDRAGLYALGTDDYWLDIGTPDKYLQAHTDTINGLVGLPPVADASEIVARCVGATGGGRRCRCDVVARPPSSARGRSSRPAPESRTPLSAEAASSALTPWCATRCSSPARAIGSGARVEGSIVGVDATVGAGADVLDCSIIGPGARVGDETSLAAARVD